MAVVVITGCSSGIGLHTAVAFARRGDQVYACVRNPNKAKTLQDIASAENLDIRIKTLDVTESAQFEPLVNEILAESSRVDVLINNAGVLFPGAWEDIPEPQARQVMETNFLGPLLLSRAFLPQMRAQGSGYIIMLSSLSGIAGLAGDVIYSASKFALEGASEALRLEIERWGIHLSLVLAGGYQTNLFRAETGNEHASPANLSNDSPYIPLIDFQQRQFQVRHDDLLPPDNLAQKLLEVANSDGSQLHWAADPVAAQVLEKLHRLSDAQRSEFMRAAGDTNWWSQGLPEPNSEP